MNNKLMLRAARIAMMAALTAPFVLAQDAVPNPSPQSALSIPQARQVQPEALNRILHEAGAEKPLVLQVGSHVLFTEAHIPGALYVGPDSQAAGLELLRSRVGSLPRTTSIVIYCGCCPWTRCPNIGPAFAALEKMGFKNVRALYLEQNFGTDWVAKGYPVEQGR
jgi:thiosulfate/3-mercaptopyruvate sulfurtransferase